MCSAQRNIGPALQSGFYVAVAEVMGHTVAQLVEALRVRFPMVSLEFFVDIILTAAVWPWG
jgi:hypothetical protein